MSATTAAPASQHNVNAGAVLIIRSAETAAREAEFMRTHVGRYALPKKLEAARRRNAGRVSVPTPDMARLVARTGGAAPALALVPDPAPTTEGAPPAPVQLAADVASLIDWAADGTAILSRGQVEALIARGIARAAELAPKPRRAPARKAKEPETIPALVAAAVAAGKPSVSVPTADLAALLAVVDAERTARTATPKERNAA